MISSTSNGQAPTKDIGEGTRGGRGEWEVTIYQLSGCAADCYDLGMV